jgi:capsular polysaccharide biosynthesis protein
MHVLNNAKIISGFVVEQSDGRCLLESSAMADLASSADRVQVYVDHEKRHIFYNDASPFNHIEGLCIYFENACGFDHWLMQSLPNLLILEWLETAGVDVSTIKLVTRRGIWSDDHKAALKASGWYDRVPESAFVNLDMLSPIVSCEQLIYPSFMWLIINECMPPGFKFSLYPVTHRVRRVFESIKQNLLGNSESTSASNNPLIFVIRRKEVNRKRLLNEEQLLKALEPLGFVGIDTAELSLQEKVKLFHGARVVVAARGAGMTLTVFCQPGTHVHQLLHDTNDFAYDQHKTIAHMMGLRFSCMFYPEATLPDDADYLASLRCFHVDIGEVVDNVKTILARPELGDLPPTNTIAA